jgi:diguanylate cyclase (GGDEF)-like protein
VTAVDPPTAPRFARLSYHALDVIVVLCLLQIALGGSEMAFGHLAYLGVVMGAWLRRSGRAAALRAVVTGAGILSGTLIAHGPVSQQLLELPLMLAIALAAAVQAHLRAEDERKLQGGNAELVEANRHLDKAREIAERSSRVDPLTGAYNRRQLEEVLEGELARGRREGGGPGVIMIDVDHFKRINDMYGHAAGDAVLVEVAGRLDSAVRGYDTIARWGGEEFCVLVPGAADDATLALTAHKLLRVVSDTPIVLGERQTIPVTVSIGAARAAGGLSTDALVDAADQALYAAKRRGRDQVCVFGQLDPDELLHQEEPDSIRTAQAFSISASVREGMQEEHNQQVAHLAGRIAEVLGKPEPFVLLCQLGGWLHDVGKVAVPEVILAKRGPLDDGEWSTMRCHPLVGEQIIDRVPGLSEATDAVRHHHERFDGSGYPDGLKGDEIPLEARIVAVADAYSAITADRTYRRSRDQAAAVKELRASAGTHLDPRLVDALVLVLRQDAHETQRRLEALGSEPDTRLSA